METKPLFAYTRNIFHVAVKQEQHTDEDEHQEVQISTQLKLFDESWTPQHSAPNPLHMTTTHPMETEQMTVRKLVISNMRFYIPKDEDEGPRLWLKLYEDPYKIKKKLTVSDLSNMCRLMLSTKPVIQFLLPAMNEYLRKETETKDGARVAVWDHDMRTEYPMIFKRWTSSNSYILNGSWKKNFVKRRNLKENDEIGLFWDPYSSRLFFSVLNRAPEI